MRYIMSGGQKISDHKSWVGKGSNGVVFPAGAKMKQYSSAEGAGAENKYEDTSEAIKMQQEAGSRKVKARPLSDSNRN
jgi:hypothetical protein